MDKWKYTVLWLAAVYLKISLSANANWKKSIEVCAFLNQRPSTEGDVVKNNSWLGKAKYVLPWGVINLQIQRVEENETCSEECGNLRKQCQFCVVPVQLIENGSYFQELNTELTPGQKYIIGDSWSRTLQGIPEPKMCLVYRGASNREYMSCNESFEDACTSEDVSSFKLIIYLDENDNESSATYTAVVTSQETRRAENEHCELILQNLKSILTVGGILIFLVIINVVCVCCCVRYQVKRKLRSLNIQQMNDSTCRPISEAITRIYKTMNAFGEEQNETYDLAAHVNKSSFEMNDKDNYDRGFFRLVTQSGDYDMAWSNTWSSPTSPDIEYDQVQNVRTLLMECLPEDEIYSKQRLPSQDISSDLNEMCNNSKENLQGCVSEMPLETINELSRKRSLDEKYSSSQNVAKIRESDHKDIDGNFDKDTQQSQNLDDSVTKQKVPCLTGDKILTENGKSRSEIKAVKNSEIREKQNTKKGGKDVNMKKVKGRRERKSGNVCNNSSEYPYGKILKTSLPRADKMVDEATSLLVANMNKVLCETKL